jgi:hypothetical protein
MFSLIWLWVVVRRCVGVLKVKDAVIIKGVTQIGDVAATLAAGSANPLLPSDRSSRRIAPVSGRSFRRVSRLTLVTFVAFFRRLFVSTAFSVVRRSRLRRRFFASRLFDVVSAMLVTLRRFVGRRFVTPFRRTVVTVVWLLLLMLL